jgi:catechol 2,3-dioxygenase-like lactoylglutathione lyase family enzyme
MNIELFTGMYQRGVAPDNPGITMEKFLHAAWATGNYDVTTRFYQDVLGFRASDWIGDRAGFFRSADRFHHSLVLLRAERPVFNHFCIQVSSLDDVMRARNSAIRAGVALRDDLLRHAPSGSIGFYMKDEARKFAVEFCVGHPQVDDSHQARILPMVPETRDVWLAPLPKRMPAELTRSGVESAETAAPVWVPGSDVPSIAAAAR